MLSLAGASKTDCKFNFASVSGIFCHAQDVLKFSRLAEEDALSSQQSTLPFSQQTATCKVFLVVAGFQADKVAYTCCLAYGSSPRELSSSCHDRAMHLGSGMCVTCFQRWTGTCWAACVLPLNFCAGKSEGPCSWHE